MILPFMVGRIIFSFYKANESWRRDFYSYTKLHRLFLRQSATNTWWGLSHFLCSINRAITPFFSSKKNCDNVFHGRGISDFEILPLCQKTFILIIWCIIDFRVRGKKWKTLNVMPRKWLSHLSQKLFLSQRMASGREKKCDKLATNLRQPSLLVAKISWRGMRTT